MDTFSLIDEKSLNTILVVIEQKNIKTCRLKVFPDKTVKFSIPIGTPEEWTRQYLESKNKWIFEKLQIFDQTMGYDATTEIRSGISIRFLGEDLIFSVSESRKNIVYKDGKVLHVCTPDINNQTALFKAFNRWWRTESLEHLHTQLDKLYPIIEKYKIGKPRIALRKMKTLWGSCSPQRNVIVFNHYLSKAKPACIEYVVLHELVHFLYPNHSKQFYSFLSSHMPDWKERKKKLDQDVVHGL